MIYIGNHVSVTRGYEAMAKEELSLGGDTFAFFPRNPRGGKSKIVTPEDIAALKELLAAENFGPLVVHGAYTMNLCSAKEEVRANSMEMITDDLIRLQQMPGHYYNFHPGSHTGQGAEIGVRQIAEGLVTAVRQTVGAKHIISSEIGMETGVKIDRNRVETSFRSELTDKCDEIEICGKNGNDTIRDKITREDTAELGTVILLETMTGKGSEMGGSFEELRAIIDKAVEISEVLGVCLDTCHVWDAGYDIVSDLDGVLAEFDRVIGLSRLKAIHLNDSKNTCGACKDRHEKLGQGMIGAEALRSVVQHPALQGLPFILETPNDDEGYRREIAMVREWMV